MKDFSPHTILRHPSISDEEVERLINLALTSLGGGPVVLFIEPSLTPREETSSPGPWLRKTKTQK